METICHCLKRTFDNTICWVRSSTGDDRIWQVSSHQVVSREKVCHRGDRGPHGDYFAIVPMRLCPVSPAMGMLWVANLASFVCHLCSTPGLFHGHWVCNVQSESNLDGKSTCIDLSYLGTIELSTNTYCVHNMCVGNLTMLVYP
jgi:hypothetical protein